MSEKAADCAQYFQDNTAWDRIFRLMRSKWEKYGRPAGILVLKDSTREERRAVSAFLGKNFSGDEIRFSVPAFAEALANSRYSEVTYPELLEAYYGEPMTTTAERRERKKEVKDRFYRDLEERYTTGVMASWVREMVGELSYGYKNVEQLRGKISIGEIQRMLDSLARAEEYLSRDEREKIPLAVLAANISGDPHFLDRNRTAGALFVNMLCWKMKVDYPQTAKEWKALLLAAGIQPDEVSSTVMTYRLHVEECEGLHSGVEAFYLLDEPLILSTVNLEKAVRAFSDSGKVYVVENEMVFSYLVRQFRIGCGDPGSALICTSGQLRTAGWELLDLLAHSNMEILYSGDLDPEGMDIADRVWKAYPEQVKLFCMEPEDYLRAVSGCELTDSRLLKMEHLEHGGLQRTAEWVRLKHCAGYQENILEEIAEVVLG